MRHCRLLCGLLIGAFSQLSYAQISAPTVGPVRYGSGGVYPVFGVQGNYVVGKRVLDRVDALSFSDAGGLVVQNGTLLLMDLNLSTLASFAAVTGNVVVGIDAGLDTAVAWLPSRRTLVYWNGVALVPVPVPEGAVGSEVFSVSKSDADNVMLLAKTVSGNVEEDLFSIRTGMLVSRSLLPGVSGDVYQQGGFILSVERGQLVSTATATGSRKVMPMGASGVTFERISGTCVHVHAASSGRDWLVHFSGDQTALFELPVPAAETSTIKAGR